MNNTLALILLATMASCWALMMVAQARVMKMLRERHAAFFAQQPAKKLTHSDDTYSPRWLSFHWRFFMRGGHASLNDTEIRRWCRLNQAFALIFVAAFAAGLVLFALSFQK